MKNVPDSIFLVDYFSQVFERLGISELEKHLRSARALIHLIRFSKISAEWIRIGAI